MTAQNVQFFVNLYFRITFLIEFEFRTTAVIFKNVQNMYKHHNGCKIDHMNTYKTHIHILAMMQKKQLKKASATHVLIKILINFLISSKLKRIIIS